MNKVLQEIGVTIVDSSVEYIDHMGDDARAAHAARVSFAKDKTEYSEDNETVEEKDVKLINYLAKHKHTSPFEHSILSVKITCPLAIRSQIMRHRTFSYNEISRRYTSQNIEFFNLKSYKKQANKNLQCSTEETIDCSEIAEHLVSQAYQHTIRTYEMLINAGLSREKARFILPQGVMTSFWMTGNLLNWFKFLALRLDAHAQEECREVAQEILGILEKHFPHTVKVFQENKFI